MTTYISKFAIGNVVWMVRSERFYRIVKCGPCSNTGKININKEKFICPKCGGRAAHQQSAGNRFYVYGSSTIGKIDISDYPDNYHKEEPNPKITYMLFDTGVGSGQLWGQKELFASEEEAQVFCDVQNSILLSDECALLQPPVDEYGRVKL